MDFSDPNLSWIGSISGLTEGVEPVQRGDPDSRRRVYEEMRSRFRTAMRELVEELRQKDIGVLLYAQEEGKEAAALGLDAHISPGMDQVFAHATELPDALHIYCTLEGFHGFFAVAREEVIRKVEEVLKERKPEVTFYPDVELTPIE